MGLLSSTNTTPIVKQHNEWGRKPPTLCELFNNFDFARCI